MSLFTIIVQLVLDVGICRSWCEIAHPDCTFVDYGMKLHLFPEVWQSFSVVAFKAAVFGRDGTFLNCHLKRL